MDIDPHPEEEEDAQDPLGGAGGDLEVDIETLTTESESEGGGEGNSVLVLDHGEGGSPMHQEASEDEDYQPPPTRRRRLVRLSDADSPEVEILRQVRPPIRRRRLREAAAPLSIFIEDDDSTDTDDGDGGSEAVSDPDFSHSEDEEEEGGGGGGGVEFSPTGSPEIIELEIESEESNAAPAASAPNSNAGVAVAVTMAGEGISPRRNLLLRWENQRLVRRNAIAVQEEEEEEDEEEVRVVRVVEGQREGDDSAEGGYATDEEEFGEWEAMIGTPEVNTEELDQALEGGERENQGGNLNVAPETRQFLESVVGDPENIKVEVESGAGPAPAIAGPSRNPGNSNTSVEDEEGQTCLICYEPYTNSGDHRLACLKCGHTYGKICIEKWIRNEARCPQCNSKAHRKEVRIIYAKNLKVVDTAERDRAMADLEREKEAKRRLELECAKLRQKFQVKEQEMSQLKQEFNFMKNRVGGIYRTEESVAGGGGGAAASSRPTAAGATGFSYSKIKTLDFQTTEARVGVFNQWLNMVTISQTTRSALFPNGLHSIRRINLLDMSQSTVPLHQKEIRDLAFSPSQSDTLLSVGLDRRAILTNCNSNVQIQSYHTECPLWSCAWNTISQYQFFLGGTNGAILSYDIRKPNQMLQRAAIPDTADGSPIVRMMYVNPSYTNLEHKFSLHGLLVQKLNSIWFWEQRGSGGGAAAGAGNGEYERYRFHQLPLEGPFLSMAFEPVSRHVLVSTRAKTGGKHLVCDLNQYFSEAQDCNVVNCDVVNTYPNVVSLSKMTRTSIYCLQPPQQPQPPPQPPQAKAPTPSCNVLIAANALRQTVSIWSISDTNWRQTLNLTEPTLDFIPCNLNNSHLLGALNSGAVHFYKGEGFS